MPKLNDTIWKAWVNRPGFPYYPAKVIDLTRNEHYDQFPVVYTLEFLVDENYEKCSDGDILFGVELDPEMSEWLDEQPVSAANAEREANERRKRPRLNSAASSSNGGGVNQEEDMEVQQALEQQGADALQARYQQNFREDAGSA